MRTVKLSAKPISATELRESPPITDLAITVGHVWESLRLHRAMGFCNGFIDTRTVETAERFRKILEAKGYQVWVEGNRLEVQW
jgi:hypothetical protein